MLSGNSRLHMRTSHAHTSSRHHPENARSVIVRGGHHSLHVRADGKVQHALAVAPHDGLARGGAGVPQPHGAVDARGVHARGAGNPPHLAHRLGVLQRAPRLQRVQVPHHQLVVQAPGGGKGEVAAHAHALHRLRVTRQRAQHLAVDPADQPRGVVLGPRHDQPRGAGVEVQAGYGPVVVRVPHEERGALATARLPQAQRAVEGARGHRLAVRREPPAQHRVGVTTEHLHQRAVPRVPHPRRKVL
mmetsp:Transcript_15753/g.38235  ORF Transcript_15753/g.38235 Transcript_15753/m.38235 type:complete len:245 (-) Transcript_15753:52-786(-)